MKNERYYYGLMKNDEKKAYKVIYDGLKVRADNIVVPLYLSINLLQEIYLRVLYDNPLFFFINQTVIKITGKSGHWLLLPEYLYTNREITLLTNDIHRIVNKIVYKADALKGNEFKLEKYLHDSVVKSVAYDYDALKKSDCFNAHSIVGVFIDKKAVCEGIAKSFKLLCNEFGIKCIVVLGKANKAGDFSGNDYHAWNIVKIRNESYHVDVTWDNLFDTETSHISYDYFNLTTKDIELDHKTVGGPLPYCDSTRLNYFYCTKSFVSTYEELIELIHARIKAKEIMFKAKKDKGEFQTFEELKEKTISALKHVSSICGTNRYYTLLFNESQNIAKIVFMSSD